MGEETSKEAETEVEEEVEGVLEVVFFEDNATLAAAESLRLALASWEEEGKEKQSE